MIKGEESSLTKIRVASDARQSEELKTERRKRNLLILIQSHLQHHGYLQSLEHLQKESSLSLRQYAAADNMDLLSILQEFEHYYSFKFGKPPKLSRKLEPEEIGKKNLNRSNAGRNSAENQSSNTPLHGSRSNDPILTKPGSFYELPSHKLNESQVLSSPLLTSMSHRVLPKISKAGSESSLGHRKGKKVKEDVDPKQESQDSFDSGLVGTNFTKPNEKQDQKTPIHDDVPVPPPEESRLLKPIPGYGNSEFRELASIITRDIYMDNPNVRWGDIAGLESSKRLVREAVVYPIKFPELFTGILSPWKGLLLYGPPGTGKTMLAKAVATECKTTFFNISASSIVSKWRGDSEKLVRVLFELARYHAPSTIFIDELDSLMGQRASEGEHEGSRRMKTEILIQMDGLAKTQDHVFILAASNLPWELDIAILRRLEKRILIGLPDDAARQILFEQSLPAGQVDANGTVLVDHQIDYADLAERTKGYSGADINLVCKEAAMKPLRKIFDLLDSDTLESNPDGLKSVSMVREPVFQRDVLEALESTRPSSNGCLYERYLAWQHQFGSS